MLLSGLPRTHLPRTRVNSAVSNAPRLLVCHHGRGCFRNRRQGGDYAMSEENKALVRRYFEEIFTTNFVRYGLRAMMVNNTMVRLISATFPEGRDSSAPPVS